MDKTYAKSDGFLHILAVCFESLTREQDDRKRLYFINVLVNAMTNEMRDKRSRAEWFASTRGRMSYFHLFGFSLIVADELRRAVKPGSPF